MTMRRTGAVRRHRACLAIAAAALAVMRGPAIAGGPSGEPAACAPVTLLLERHGFDLTVPVDVLGSRVQFALDLGTSDSYMLREGRARFALPPARDPPAWAVDDVGGSRTQAEFVSVASIRFGGVEHGPLTMPVMDLGYPADAEARQSEMGLLGNDLLADYDLDLDAPGHTLILHPIAAPCAPSPPAWTATATRVPLRFSKGNNPVVPISVDGRTIDAVFDTGSQRTLIKDPSRGPDGALHPLGLFGSAETGTRPLRGVRLAIGDVVEAGFPVRVAEADGVLSGRSLLGIDFIGRRRFWLSRRTNRLFISALPAR